MMEGYVVVEERYTRTSWERKVGDGPWQQVDLAPFGGKPPVIFLNPEIEWEIRRTWERPEAELLRQRKETS